MQDRTEVWRLSTCYVLNRRFKRNQQPVTANSSQKKSNWKCRQLRRQCTANLNADCIRRLSFFMCKCNRENNARWHKEPKVCTWRTRQQTWDNTNWLMSKARTMRTTWNDTGKGLKCVKWQAKLTGISGTLFIRHPIRSLCNVMPGGSKWWYYHAIPLFTKHCLTRMKNLSLDADAANGLLFKVTQRCGAVMLFCSV